MANTSLPNCDDVTTVQSGLLSLCTDDRSLLEELPRELVLKIIEYVPEPLFELRLVSRELRSVVDEYVLSPVKIPIVERLIVTERPPDGANVWLNIPKSKVPLFELRLKLRQPRNDLCTRIKRFFHVLPYHPNHYSLEFDTLPDDGSVECLRYCLGGSIEDTEFSNYDEQITKTTVPRLIEGIRLINLKIYIDLLSDEAAERLLSNLKAHRVEQLFLTIREVKCSKPVQILLELSSLVRSLHLSQLLLAEVEYRVDCSYLFGAKDIDWTPVILKIFTKKLDKLHIRNDYHGFLPILQADTLRERLPRTEKRIWFETSCIAYGDGLNYTANEYAVKAKNASYRPHGFLSIKHVERENEIFEL